MEKGVKKVILFIFLFFSVSNNFYAIENLNINFFKFNPKTPIEISSDYLEIDTGNKTVYIFDYKKNVVLNHNGSKIYSDRLKIYYNKDKKEIVKACILGNVKIKSKNIISSCNEAYYSFLKEYIVLKGDVKIMQNDNIFYGEELDIDLKNNKTFLKGGKKRINTFFSGQK